MGRLFLEYLSQPCKSIPKPQEHRMTHWFSCVEEISVRTSSNSEMKKHLIWVPSDRQSLTPSLLIWSQKKIPSLHHSAKAEKKKQRYFCLCTGGGRGDESQQSRRTMCWVLEKSRFSIGTCELGSASWCWSPERWNGQNSQGNFIVVGFSPSDEWSWFWSIYHFGPSNESKSSLGKVFWFRVTRANSGPQTLQGFSIVLQYNHNKPFASASKTSLFPLFLLSFWV